MDLRVKKTRRAIRSAFYSLLLEKPFEKITVKDVAERAEINKTTFYSHYDTIYDLADQLEKEAVESVVERMDDAQLLLTDPRRFVQELAQLLSEFSLPISKLPPVQSTRFAEHLRYAAMCHVQKEGIDAEQYEAIGTILVFLVNGLLGLQSQTPELAKRHMDAIADLVAGGIGAVSPMKK